MYISAYLRASTAEQHAGRARKALEAFAADQGVEVSAWYIETASGASLARPELMLLLERAPKNSVLLIEQVDRLSRLEEAGWERLKMMVRDKGLNIVSLDLPMSFALLHDQSGRQDLDAFTSVVLRSFSRMMLDILAAVARKDYEDRRRRQAEGVARAKAEGKFKGRPVNEAKHAEMRRLRAAGLSIKDVAQYTGVSVRTVTRVTKTS